MGRTKEPALWALFSSGGMLAALFLPAVVFLFWIAGPLNLLAVSGYAELLRLARHPLARLFLFALTSLSFFHWAHRFRYTLYDGLQLYHLNQLIAVLTYGIATILTLGAAYLLFLLL